MAAALYSVDVIAKLFDLTPRRVQQLAAEGTIPRAARGQYELVPAVKAYIKYLKDRAINADVTDGEEGDHKRRLVKARADIAEMEAERLAGNQVECSKIEAIWTDAAARFRQRTLSIAHKAAPLVATENDIAACHAILESQIFEALSELSTIPVESAAAAAEVDNSSTESSLTAAEDDDLAMGGPIQEAEQRV